MTPSVNVTAEGTGDGLITTVVFVLLFTIVEKFIPGASPDVLDSFAIRLE